LRQPLDNGGSRRPRTYSEELGGHTAMIRHRMGKSLTEEQRQHWMQLLLRCADDCGIPIDPEFRSGTAYLKVLSNPGGFPVGSGPSSNVYWAPL